MKNAKRILLALVCLVLAVSVIGAISIFAAEENDAPENKGEIQVWLIAGQSNAVGYGEEIPEDAKTDPRFTEGFDNVIAYGRLAAEDQTAFAPVKVGMGKNTTSVGAEIGIASALGNSDEMHAVIKYAVGATKLHPMNAATWTSPSYIEAVQNDDDTANDINSKWTKVGDYYDTFMKTVEEGLALLVAEGYTPVIKGLWWMQGEAETTLDADWAPEYEKLLTYLVDDMRADLAKIANDPTLNGEDPMPFVIGKINRNPATTEPAQQEKVEIVNAAQAKVSEKRANVSVVDAKKAYSFYQYDSWHYNTETQMYLGEQFVAEVLKYENKYLVSSDGKYAGINTGMYTAGERVTVNFKLVDGYSVSALTMQIGDAEPVAVELTDGSYVIDSMPAANVRFAVTMSADDVVTEYGIIPGEYFDVNDYPFAIFKGGEFLGADNRFAIGAIPTAANAGDGAVILVRRNFDMSKESNMHSRLSVLNGSMTIDLGGYTVTMGGVSSGFDGMIKCEAHKLGYVTNVNMKNGTVILGEDPIVRVSGANDEARTSAEYVAGYAENPQKFTVTFDGLTIKYDERYSGFSSTLLYSYENLSGNHPTLSDATLIVKDCELDFGSVSNAFYVFRTGNINVKCEILGGSIKIDDPSFMTMLNGSGATLSVGTGSLGEYTKLILPAGASYPDTSIKTTDGNNYGFKFVKSEGESNEYQLSLGASTKYGFIPEKYASATDYPWVIFDTNGNFLGGTKVWANYNNLDVSATNIASTAGVDTVILLRANYTTKQSGTNNTNVQSTMSRHDGTITIDLNGFTVTNNNSSVDAFIKGEANRLGATTNIILKNGKYVTLNNAMLRFSATGSETRTNAEYLAGCATNPQTFNVTFEDLDIVIPDGTASYASGVISYTSTKDAADVKMNCSLAIKNCNIDYGTDTAVKPLFGASKAIPYTVTVTGCTIKANDLSAFKYTASSYATMKISQDENCKYIQLLAPAGTEVSAGIPKEAIYSAVKDLAYVKVGTDGDYDVYELQSPTLTTPYGNINAKYYDSAKYPWIVFDKDGRCVCATKYFTTTAAEAACTAGDGSVIYLRRDFNFDTDKQGGGTQSLTKINGTITVDLAGNIVTMGKGGSADAFIRCEAFASGYTTNIIVTNGKIVAGQDPLVRFSAIDTRWPEGYNTNTDPAKVHNFYVTFEDLDISIDESADMQGSYVIMFGAPTQGTSIKLSNNNVTVKNCNIDLTNSVKATQIFGSPSTIKANGYLIGGSITFGSNKPAVSGIFGETFYVDKDENGSYTVFNYAKGDSAHTTQFKTVDGGKVVLAKISENAETSVYTFVDASVQSYSPKMSITLESQLVMNVYVPVKNTEAFTIDGKTPDYKIVTLGNAEYYLVSIKLDSAAAARDIKLVATVKLGDKSANGSFTFSIPKYAVKVINDVNATEIEKTLVKDVLAYVQAAYNYFADYNTADEIARVNAIVDELLALGGDYFGEPTISGTTAKDKGGIVTGVTLNLDYKPTIRFYVTDTNVEFKIGNTVLNTVKDVEGKYVELDVYAYALAETITFGDGGSYHISDFLEKTLEDETLYETENYEELLNLICCFIKYTEGAANYRNSVVNK